jgi:hypothetical protein
VVRHLQYAAFDKGPFKLRRSSTHISPSNIEVQIEILGSIIKKSLKGIDKLKKPCYYVVYGNRLPLAILKESIKWGESTLKKRYA